MPTLRWFNPFRGRSNTSQGSHSQEISIAEAENYSNVDDGDGSSSSGGQQTRERHRVFRVTVPDNIRPGNRFRVTASNRIFNVRCPHGAQSGQQIQVSLPVLGGGGDESENEEPGNSQQPVGHQGREESSLDQEPIEYAVTVPPGINPGQQFPISLGGRIVFATCPSNGYPGMPMRLLVPPLNQFNRAGDVQEGVSLDVPPQEQQNDDSSSLPSLNVDGGQQHEPQRHVMFEVTVPNGVIPGSHFAVLANGSRVLVTCPQEASPGTKIRFFLPQKLNIDKKKFPALVFSKDGWTRIIRATDMKFQWIRLNSDGATDDYNKSERFDTDKSAYVCKLSDGAISWLPASEGVVQSNLRDTQGRELFNFADIASAQKKSFNEKSAWFKAVCNHLLADWSDGHIQFNIRSDHLLQDSVQSVMGLPKSDLRKIWRFQFIGNRAIDAGGLKREWFEQVTSKIFDPDVGLWQTSVSNQGCLQIQSASAATLSDDDHLMYYRFTGRVLGKALLDGEHVTKRMVPYMYKYLLGWPVTFADLRLHDNIYYNSLQHFKGMDDVSMLCQTFVTTEDIFGDKQDTELVPGGSSVDVTNENLSEYLEACLRYRMLGKIEPQLTALLQGFFDVIPEPILSVFHFQELELLLCGLPEINVDDWKENTLYTGFVEDDGINSPICQWFWEVVTEFDNEMKTRLLLFVTGVLLLLIHICHTFENSGLIHLILLLISCFWNKSVLWCAVKGFRISPRK